MWSRMKEYAKSQLDYALGDNPMSGSLISPWNVYCDSLKYSLQLPMSSVSTPTLRKTPVRSRIPFVMRRLIIGQTLLRRAEVTTYPRSTHLQNRRHTCFTALWSVDRTRTTGSGISEVTGRKERCDLSTCVHTNDAYGLDLGRAGLQCAVVDPCRCSCHER